QNVILVIKYTIRLSFNVNRVQGKVVCSRKRIQFRKTPIRISIDIDMLRIQVSNINSKVLQEGFINLVYTISTHSNFVPGTISGSQNRLNRKIFVNIIVAWC